MTEFTLHFIQFTVFRCPAFRKLTTLLLNEWCLAADFGALSCILQHSPVLEKLILLVNEVGDYPIAFACRLQLSLGPLRLIYFVLL